MKHSWDKNTKCEVDESKQEGQIIHSFLQKVGSWGGLIVQLDRILTDIRREETGVAVNGNPYEQLIAFIEKVSKQPPKIAKTGGGE